MEKITEPKIQSTNANHLGQNSGDLGGDYGIWQSPDKIISNKSIETSSVSIRRMPYPYLAMLAICSDLDETPDEKTYFETIKYLNTTENTSMGRGVGLEIGNSIFFNMPKSQFSYWNADEQGRSRIRTLIRSGHIDCLHSFGDLATTRNDAVCALAELKRHDCSLKVWVDHAVAASNFGGDIMMGEGDLLSSSAYHADLTVNYGIKYVWRGRVTSVIGQEIPRKYGGIGNLKFPIASAKTLTKEFLKNGLANFGFSKYSMHTKNQLLRKVKLRSGHNLFEFIRSNPNSRGVSYGESADGIGQVLEKKIFDTLIERQGMCVLYTHLGKIRNKSGIFCQSTKKGFSLLSSYHAESKILVTTTRRLLDYCLAVRDTDFSANLKGNILTIDIRTKKSLSELSGLTFYVPDNRRIRINVNDRENLKIIVNAPDHFYRRSVSIPWQALRFPDL